MNARPQILVIDGTRYVLIKESEFRKIASSATTRRNPKGRAVATLDALQFAAHSIGKKIASLRKESGMTQLELARKARVRPETVSRIERGEGNPTARTINSLLKAMGNRGIYLTPLATTYRIFQHERGLSANSAGTGTALQH